MAEKQKVIKLENIGIYGVIRQAEVDDNLIPDGAVVEAVNVNFDRKGAVQLRPGISNLGGTVVADGSCYGIFNATFSTSGVIRPLAVFTKSGSSSIYMYQSGSWSVTLDGDTGTLQTDFVNFNDAVVRFNGTDNMKVWTGGGTWITSGGQINPDDMVSYDTKYGEVYKSRIYTAGNSTYRNRLYFSSVISSTGLIDWTPTTDYVDINPSDGEEITGLKRYGIELLTFKPSYIYRFKTSGVDPDPLINVGTRSNNSIIEGKKGLYFHHDSGFYIYSGGMPEEISRPISDIVEKISFSNYSSICSWIDNDHIYWSVGNITIEGTTWSNVVLRYTESSQIWTVYSYAKKLMTAATYVSSSSITQISGSNDGHVYTLNTGYTDEGTPIGYWFITKWYYFGSISDRKLIQRMAGICDKAQGSKIHYQIDEDDHWIELGQLRKYLTDFDQKDIRFHRIRFKVRGISSQEAFIFKGFQITNYTNEGIII